MKKKTRNLTLITTIIFIFLIFIFCFLNSMKFIAKANENSGGIYYIMEKNIIAYSGDRRIEISIDSETNYEIDNTNNIKTLNHDIILKVNYNDIFNDEIEEELYINFSNINYNINFFEINITPFITLRDNNLNYVTFEILFFGYQVDDGIYNLVYHNSNNLTFKYSLTGWNSNDNYTSFLNYEIDYTTYYDLLTLKSDDTSYKKGYQDGLKGSYSPSWMENLFNSLNIIFNVEIFPNFKLWYLIGAPLMVAVVVAVLKFLR